MSAPTLLSLLDLPTELLIEISSQSINPHLPLVCRQFYNIIYSTPSFWQRIRIGVRQHTPDGPDFLARRLGRSATCPLDVTIRDVERPPPTDKLWHRLSYHRDRIHTLSISTDTATLGAEILHAVVLTPPAPSSFPSLQKLDIRHDEAISNPFLLEPIAMFLRPIPSLFPALSTLVLPAMRSCMPNLESPMPSLKTLVLDGSKFRSWACPTIRLVGEFLAKLPGLETFWCKLHRMDSGENFSDLSGLSWLEGPSPHYPVLLPKLTKLAITVPGFGVDLLHIIAAPALQDLHMDGVRNDDVDWEQVAWLSWFPATIHAGLVLTASRSPGLRHLSLLRAYLPRTTWEWLLGCTPARSTPTPTRELPLPFPFLESIAVRQMEAVNWEVTNPVDDALIEQYAWHGRLVLRRFAYMTSEPPLRGVALHQLINGLASKLDADQIFELELDGTFGVDTKERLGNILTTKVVRVILHEEPPQRTNWWALGRDIDPTEADSY